MRDLWVVALGDSFASGQGVPDVEAAVFTRRKAQWIDGELCFVPHRNVSLSGLSFRLLFIVVLWRFTL